MTLLQEELIDDPWKMLIACMLLNQTASIQVRRVIWKLLERYPTAVDMASADHCDVVEMIKECGLYNRRASAMIKMSEQCASDPYWQERPEALFGIGRYALDSWKIFQLGMTDIEVTDKVLKSYLERL